MPGWAARPLETRSPQSPPVPASDSPEAGLVDETVLAPSVVDETVLAPSVVDETVFRPSVAENAGIVTSFLERQPDVTITSGWPEETGAPTFYDTLGLGRGASTEVLAATLRDHLEPAWRLKAERPGRTGERASAMLVQVTEALRVFSSDAARAAYDAAHPAGGSAPVEAVWLAWGFFFQRAWEQALATSRRACTESPQDPMAHVVRAWAELAGGNVHAASLAADQAYAVGWQGDDLADVYHVRGAVLTALGQHDAACENLASAIDRAAPGERPELFLRKAAAEEGRGATTGMIAACVRGLTAEPAPSVALRTRLEQTAIRAFHAKCHVDGAPAESAARYAETRRGWLSSAVPEPSKSTLLDFFDQAIRNEQQRAAG